MKKVNKRLAGWGTCSVQGETENLVLPWKDAPSIRIGSQQHFTATDIQTGRECVEGITKVLTGTVFFVWKEHPRVSDMERSSCLSEYSPRRARSVTDYLNSRTHKGLKPRCKLRAIFC